jgi:hypothetical protein
VTRRRALLACLLLLALLALLGLALLGVAAELNWGLVI